MRLRYGGMEEGLTALSVGNNKEADIDGSQAPDEIITWLESQLGEEAEAGGQNN